MESEIFYNETEDEEIVDFDYGVDIDGSVYVSIE